MHTKYMRGEGWMAKKSAINAAADHSISSHERERDVAFVMSRAHTISIGNLNAERAHSFIMLMREPN